jgi:hypothetical protein
MSRGQTVKVEDLVGALVRGRDGRRVGHIEELRVARREGEYQITEYLLGSGAILERWSVTRNLFGPRGRTLIARWDQLDISDPRQPRLTCATEEIETDDGGTR